MINTFHVVKEIFHILIYPFAWLLSLFIPKTHYSKKPTILLVERWFVQNPFHRKWKAYLENKGLDVHIVNFPIYKGAFSDSARELKEYIDRSDFSEIVLVGISSGALTSFLYLEDLEGWSKVKKFISIGAPFYGTPMGYFISFIKSGRELIPGSKFSKYIKEKNIKNIEKITCVRGRFDEMAPRDSSVLNGAREIEIDTIGHNNLHLEDVKTYDVVANIARED